MILLSPSDFETGFFQLAQSIATNPVIQSYIDRFEAHYIRRILGVQLGDLFIAGIAANPVDARFVKIRDPFTAQDSGSGLCGCGGIMESKGMKDTLKGLIYYEYVSETQVRHSQGGVIINQSEVSTNVPADNTTRFAEQKWNQALISVGAIQWFVGKHDEVDYPEYNGVCFKFRYAGLL